MSQVNMDRSFTQKLHRTPYPAIDPTKPSLSARGKTVLITGGSTGIGLAISTAFAAARAANIVIISRSLEKLYRAKNSIESTYPSTAVHTFAASVTDAERTSFIFQDVRAHIAEPDILILCAGSLSLSGPTLTVGVEHIWLDFETNVKANLAYVRQYLRPDTLTKEKIILNVSSSAVHLPELLGVAAYGASKAAFVRLLTQIQLEHQGRGVRIVSFQPGAVLTAFTKAAGCTEETLDWDDVSLPGHFSVWLASAEARFLTGRFVYANWDVEELKGRAAEIERSDLLKIGLIGEPAGGAVAGNGVACLNDRFGRTCGYHV